MKHQQPIYRTSRFLYFSQGRSAFNSDWSYPDTHLPQHRAEQIPTIHGISTNGCTTQSIAWAVLTAVALVFCRLINNPGETGKREDAIKWRAR